MTQSKRIFVVLLNEGKSDRYVSVFSMSNECTNDALCLVIKIKMLAVIPWPQTGAIQYHAQDFHIKVVQSKGWLSVIVVI